MSNSLLLALTSAVVMVCLVSKYLKFEKFPPLGGHINLVYNIGALLSQACSLIVCDYSKIYANGVVLDKTFLCIQIVLASLNITLLLSTLFSKSKKETKNLVIGILGIVLMVIFMPRNYVYDGILNVKSGADNTTVILRWLYSTVFLVFPMLALFKNKYLKSIALIYGIPIVLITIANFTRHFAYFVDYEESLNGIVYNYESAKTAMKLGKDIRLIQFILELTVALTIPLYLIFVEGYCPEFVVDFTTWIKGKITKKEVDSSIKKRGLHDLKYFLIMMIGVFIIIIPLNFFESVFVLNNRVTNNLSISVAFVQFLIFTGVFVAHVILRRYNKQTSYMILVIMAFALFLQFNAHYRAQMKLSNIPLQLCHVGTYVVFISLATKWRPILYFALLVNVTGAFIGLVSPETGHALFTSDQMTFTYEHGLIMMIPCIALSLGIIPMPTKKDFKYATISYTCYFTFSLLLGVWLRNYSGSVNYFYLFNDVVGRLFPFANHLMIQKLRIYAFGLTFEFMPFYQVAIYFGYLTFIYILYNVFHFLQKFIYETKKALLYRRERLLVSGSAGAIKRERVIDISVVCFFSVIILGYIIYTIHGLIRIASMI